MMTKKDFIMIADALNESAFADWGQNSKDVVADALVRAFKASNPAFNEERWRDFLAGKCGPNGGTVKEGK